MTKRFITPEVAQALIDECEHAPDLMDTLRRPIRAAHVAYLARQMERGAFGNNLIDVVDCRKTGQRFIVNGNHTLRAIVKSGARLHLTFEETPCETIQDVRLAYSRYDRGLVRSRKDAMRSLNAVDGTGLPLSHVGYLASAVAFMMDDYRLGQNARRSKGMGDDELYSELAAWAAEFQVLREIVGGTKTWESRIIRRRGVLSVALVTIRANKSKAIDFWTGVVSGVDIPRHSPILKVRDYLMETGIIGNSSRPGAMVHPDEMARTVAYCWDKFVTGTPVKQMKVPGGPVVVRFASV